MKLTTLFAEFEYGHPFVTNPEMAVSTAATSHALSAIVLLVWTALAPVAGLVYFRNRDLR